MKNETYYLSSLESTTFEKTRKCSFLKTLQFDTGKDCVLAEIDPPVIGQQYGVVGDIKYVVLANRHEGYPLSPIREFPCFVFIARPLIDDIASRNGITKNDLQIIGWGELYRTQSDAENHVFD
jgi:hypothetical protein